MVPVLLLTAHPQVQEAPSQERREVIPALMTLIPLIPALIRMYPDPALRRDQGPHRAQIHQGQDQHRVLTLAILSILPDRVILTRDQLPDRVLLVLEPHRAQVAARVQDQPMDRPLSNPENSNFVGV